MTSDIAYLQGRAHNPLVPCGSCYALSVDLCSLMSSLLISALESAKPRKVQGGESQW